MEGDKFLIFLLGFLSGFIVCFFIFLFSLKKFLDLICEDLKKIRDEYDDK